MSDFSVSSELLARYVLNRQKDLELLKQCLQQKDYSVIARKAHNMKGSAESFGFPELGFIGDELETAAINQREEQIQAHIAKIEQWIQEKVVQN